MDYWIYVLSLSSSTTHDNGVEELRAHVQTLG